MGNATGLALRRGKKIRPVVVYLSIEDVSQPIIEIVVFQERVSCVATVRLPSLLPPLLKARGRFAVWRGNDRLGFT